MARRLIRRVWLHAAVGWMAVCTAEPREKIILMSVCGVGHHHGNQLRDEMERECNHGMSWSTWLSFSIVDKTWTEVDFFFCFSLLWSLQGLSVPVVNQGFLEQEHRPLTGASAVRSSASPHVWNEGRLCDAVWLWTKSPRCTEAQLMSSQIMS